MPKRKKDLHLGGWMLRDQSKLNTNKKSPWERNSNPHSVYADDRNYSSKSSFPSRCYKNRFLDIIIKKTALRASTSVVSLVSYSGTEEIFQCTGTIIEEVGTILTGAELVKCPTSKDIVAKNLKARLSAYDFYYGIAIVNIQGNVPQLKPASLKLVDDRISVDANSSELHIDNDKGRKPRPGDKVIAIGRYFNEPYDLMAAPGEFLSEVSEIYGVNGCDKELFTTSCLITNAGIGGPIINDHSEVIGVAFYDTRCTPFLPINIALKWWDHHKNYGELRQQPLLGMELANFYTANLLVMEKIILKFPNYEAGAIVEDVEQGSSASIAGICPNDVIVTCCGNPVGSFLELCDILWDKIGDDVEMVVLRASDDAPLNFEIKAVEAN